MTDATHGSAARIRARVRLVVALAFLYGVLSMGVLLQLSDGRLGVAVLEPIVVLQVALVPVAGFVGYVTYVGRPALMSVVAVAALGGAAVLTIGLLLVTPADHVNITCAASAGSGCLVLIGFVPSWAILGFGTGTAARWRRRSTVSWRRLAAACVAVIIAGVFIGLTYAVLVESLSNWGDQVL